MRGRPKSNKIPNKTLGHIRQSFVVSNDPWNDDLQDLIHFFLEVGVSGTSRMVTQGYDELLKGLDINFKLRWRIGSPPDMMERLRRATTTI
jgi:hypothetical protein